MAVSRAVLLGGFAALLLASACVSPVNDGRDLQSLGLSYRLKTLTAPRPIRAHILKINLAAGQVEPVVLLSPDPDGSGPAEAVLTDPFALAGGPPVLAFINTNPWDGLPDPATGKPDRLWREGLWVTISGLAMSNRTVRSQAEKDGNVCVTADGRIHITSLTNGMDAVAGAGGWQSIVRNGEVTARDNKSLAPRTAIGTDATGALLWLVVVDGRQPGFSEGMSVSELGGLMKELGCREAANMDGGGSSVMGLAGAGGALRLVNSPSDRLLGFTVVRPLPMILALRLRRPAN